MNYNPTAGFQPEIIVDEKRGLMLHTAALSAQQFARYFRSGMKWQRHDLYGYQRWYFHALEAHAQKFLCLNRRRVHQELVKIDRWYTPQFKKYLRPALLETLVHVMPPVTSDDYLGNYRSWTDRSKLVNYVERLNQKIADYGINFKKGDPNREEKKQRIKELFKSFINRQ